MSEAFQASDGVDGQNGQHGTTEVPGGWRGENGTDGASISVERTGLVSDEYYALNIIAGRGGHGGRGGDGYYNSWSVPGAWGYNVGWGGDGGTAGRGGDAHGIVSNATSNHSLRIDATAGNGGSAGWGGNAGTYPYSNEGWGAFGGDGGIAGVGGSASARILGSTLASFADSSVGGLNSLALTAFAQAGHGGSAGSGGNGGGGTPAGGPGWSYDGGRGGDATAIISGNNLHGEAGVWITAISGAGIGGMGYDAPSSGPINGGVVYGKPSSAGAGGHAHTEVSNNIIRQTDGSSKVEISLHAWGYSSYGGSTYVDGNFIPGRLGEVPTGNVIFSGNQIYLGGGDDTFLLRVEMAEGFEFSASDNIISGGSGYDTLILETRLLSLAGASRVGTIDVNVGALGLSGFEAVRGTGSHDIIRSGDRAMVVDGDAGDDRLYGGSGRDTLLGGYGDDFLFGGNGGDMLDGGDGVDTASYAGSTGKATVDLLTTGAQGTGATGQDTLISIENLIGTDFADLLQGTQGVNQLDGGDGNDRLFGRGGADVLIGGNGDDRLDGGGAQDMLIGGAGRDTLTGGAGADRFVFLAGDTGSTRAAADIITDFSREQRDKIDLSQFDAKPTTEILDAFIFRGENAFTGREGELRYLARDGVTLVMGDLDGDKAADLVIRINGEHSLIASDFVFAPPAPIIDALI